VGELVESWGNLQTLVKDLLLTLKLDVMRPLDKARDVALGLDVLTNTKVLGSLFNQWVGGSLAGLLTLQRIRCRGNLLSGRFLVGWRLSSSDKGFRSDSNFYFFKIHNSDKNYTLAVVTK
jgi:hypothetical protein